MSLPSKSFLIKRVIKRWTLDSSFFQLSYGLFLILEEYTNNVQALHPAFEQFVLDFFYM